MNLKNNLGILLSILNLIIPKKNIILFNSFPAYSDNSFALYKYILENRKDITDKYQLIWGQDKNDVIPKYLEEYKVITVDKKSMSGIITFLRAKYIISTHGYFPGVKSGNGQLQINLWHGCGYKDLPARDHIYHGDINIVTSKEYVPIHAKVFDLNEKRIKVTGLPRNDLLFGNYNNLVKFSINKEKYNKIYIWMPTYRKASIGHDGVDGDDDSFTFSNLNKKQLVRLNNVLAKNNSFLIVKLHPMDSKSLNLKSNLSNILCITNDDLSKKNILLYELISETDCLLSDYSSVIVDYLLLDKPIVMVLSDLIDYEKNRGFVFKDVKNYMPGPVISNFDLLVNYFENSYDIDKSWEEKRHKISYNLHKYKDNRSSMRICNMIWGKSN